MFDMFEMMTIQASNDSIAVAANKAMEATSLLPGLPQIDSRVLQAAKMGAAGTWLACGRPWCVENPCQAELRRTLTALIHRSTFPQCRHLPEHPVWRAGFRHDRNYDGEDRRGAGADGIPMSGAA